MRDIPDKEMAKITDEVETRIAETLLSLYNRLAEQYGFKQVEADELYDMGIWSEKLPEMRELAIQLFYRLGMNVQGDGKGF